MCVKKAFNGSKQEHATCRRQTPHHGRVRLEKQTTDASPQACAHTKKHTFTHHGVRLEQGVLLVPGPGVLSNRRVQLVVPPLPALLPRSAVELGANETPVLGAVLEHLWFGVG